jgi:hypothetical protein
MQRLHEAMPRQAFGIPSEWNELRRGVRHLRDLLEQVEISLFARTEQRDRQCRQLRAPEQRGRALGIGA